MLIAPMQMFATTFIVRGKNFLSNALKVLLSMKKDIYIIFFIRLFSTYSTRMTY